MLALWLEQASTRRKHLTSAKEGKHNLESKVHRSPQQEPQHLQGGCQMVQFLHLHLLKRLCTVVRLVSFLLVQIFARLSRIAFIQAGARKAYDRGQSVHSC